MVVAGLIPDILLGVRRYFCTGSGSGLASTSRDGCACSPSGDRCACPAGADPWGSRSGLSPEAAQEESDSRVAAAHAAVKIFLTYRMIHRFFDRSTVRSESRALNSLPALTEAISQGWRIVYGHPAFMEAFSLYVYQSCP